MTEADCKKRSLRDLLARLPEESILFLVLLGLCTAVSILSPYFLTFDNVINIIMDVSVSGIAAIGMTFVIISGGIDLTVGSTLALSSVIAASFAKNGSPVVVVILIGLGVGLGIGLLNGLAVTKLRMPPLIVTLAMLGMGRGVQLIYSKATTIFGLGDAFGVLGRGTIGRVPVPVILTLLLYVLASVILSRTSFGRRIYAVGGNQRAARICGIHVTGITLSVYLISAVLAAFAGLMLISRMDSAPSIIGIGLEMDAVAAVVIGGTSLNGGNGGIWGTLIGVTILGVINNALNLLNVSPYYQQFVQGLIIFIAVAIDANRKRRSETA